MSATLYLEAGLWVGLALLAALVAIRLSVPVALCELLVGAIAANVPGLKEHVTSVPFVTFLAATGSIVLTFLAGAEVEPTALRRHWRASVVLGVLAFVVPFAAAFAVCRFGLHWEFRAAELGAVALSTTSVAVVYAMLVETGHTRTDVGKRILGACFVSGLCTLAALGGLFSTDLGRLAIVAVVIVAALLVVPRAFRAIVDRLGHPVSEPELKLVLCALFALGGLATWAGSQAVLAAYLVGLVLAGALARDRVPMDKLRSIAFALLTPFFFLRAGTLLHAPTIAAEAGVIAVLLAVTLAAKWVAVWPATRVLGLAPGERAYTTLLMSTGLTFGAIAALYGLAHHLVDETQYTVLLAVIVLSALLPALLAQWRYQPAVEPQDADDDAEEEALGAQDAVLRRHHRAGEASG